VHVSHRDALAFCAWDGSRLPTEAEWEYAARGGLESTRFPWGDELGERTCNVFRGEFPDGVGGTVPVDAYEPNGFGLHNVIGNVWEWSADHFGPDTHAIRGGSYTCHDSHCTRYRLSARTGNAPDASMGNLGFRVAA
jgi:formylglycine-generating enzyme required for sulfatase activity